MGSVDGMGCSKRSYGTTVQLETKAPALSKLKATTERIPGVG